MLLGSQEEKWARLWHVRSIPEQEDHDQGVGKADFGSVDGAIAGAFDDGEDVMVARVEDDAFDCSLYARGCSQSASRSLSWF